MARIRTIKPEFWTSEQVMECSTNARLLFIGLWNFCDDAGRMPASAKRIKASVFPSDDFSAEDVRRMLDELSANGLIVFYVVDGIEYLQVTGWHHQKIDRAQKAKFPPPPDPNSPNGRRTFDVGREGNTEGKGEEKKVRDSRPGPSSHPARPVLNEAGPEAPPRAGAGPVPAWSTRSNLDRVEARCRRDLDGGGPQDFAIGPIARLEAEGYDLEAEIIPALIDLAASGRSPIRTWKLYAERIRERVDRDRAARPAHLPKREPGRPSVAIRHHGTWYVDDLKRVIAQWRKVPASWPIEMLGRPPGEPECVVPREFLVEVAA